MLAHITIFAVCVPLQLGLGVWNTRRKWLTPGEVRFWGMSIFVTVEFIYLGAL